MDTRVDTHTELLLAARTAHVRRDWDASYKAFVTVGRHLANIYAKLGVSSRTAAVAWAHANNLL